MSTPSKKQALAVCSNPLLQAGLLEVTFEFVGPGEALFIRAVNSSWKACYDKLTTASQQDCSEEHVHGSSCTAYPAVFASASRVKAALKSGLRFDKAKDKLCVCAGRHAGIDALAAAHELGLPFSAAVMRGAASSRCLSKLQWLHIEQQCPFPGEITMIAARAGDVEMLRWLKSAGCCFDKWTSLRGAQSGNNLNVLQFLHAEGCPWHPNVCGAAGEAGDLEQLKWLFSHGATVDNSTAMIAARGGAVPVLEWLQQQQQDVELKEHTMCCAAEHGHLQLCQWLHTQQCPWDDTATFSAARYNHCATLRWLIESGCPHDVTHVLDILSAAVLGARNGDFNTLQYLYECGIMASSDVLTDTLNTAGAHNKLAVAQWLRQHGAEWPAVLRSPFYNDPWHGETLAWARAEGCTSPTEPLH
jgi:hypothetical protein